MHILIYTLRDFQMENLHCKIYRSINATAIYKKFFFNYYYTYAGFEEKIIFYSERTFFERKLVTL